MAINDMRLNKSGTVGTEPVARLKDGKYEKGTEVKLGRLGAVFLPGKEARYDRKVAKIENKVVKAGNRYARNIEQSKKTVMSDDSQATLTSTLTPKIAAKRYTRRMDTLAAKRSRVDRRFNRDIY